MYSVARNVCRAFLNSVLRRRDIVMNRYYRRRMKIQGGFGPRAGEITEFLEGDVGNRHLRNKINDGAPLMVARHGLYELLSCVECTKRKRGISESAFLRLCNNAGFFPDDVSLVDRFAEVYLASTASLDVFAISWYRHGYLTQEESIFRDYCPNACLLDIRVLDAFHRIVSTSSHFQLVLLGDTKTEYAASVIQRVSNLGFNARVHFAGMVQDMGKFYGPSGITVGKDLVHRSRKRSLS
jgi:hypothetical protein